MQVTDEMIAAYHEVLGNPAHRDTIYREVVRMAIKAAIDEGNKKEDQPILGYLPGGKRIHPIKPGMIATACVVSCAGCYKVIRGMGGPKRGALCPTCWEAK